MCTRWVHTLVTTYGLHRCVGPCVWHGVAGQMANRGRTKCRRPRAGRGAVVLIAYMYTKVQIIKTHCEQNQIADTDTFHTSVIEHLNALTIDERHALVNDTHIWPDYYGNRSPIADERMRAAVVGVQVGRIRMCVLSLKTVKHARRRHVSTYTNSIWHTCTLLRTAFVRLCNVSTLPSTRSSCAAVWPRVIACE